MDYFNPPLPLRQQEIKLMSSSPTAASAGRTRDTMEFSEALKQVVDGELVTKLEWNDPETYLLLQADILHIRKSDGSVHVLKVSAGDIAGDDYVIVTPRPSEAIQ